jgi:thioredoxin reductase (NADPH)
MEQTQHDVVVIGAGITGLIAARSALQSGRSVMILESLMFGGLVINVNELTGETPGSGADLASGLMSEVMDGGGESISGTAASVARHEGRLLVTSDCGAHRAGAVIVASGAALKRLGVPGEAELEHKGVAHCADCDGPFYTGQDVTVVGGGDSALQSALVLAKTCREVHLVHRGARFRAQQHFVDAVGTRKNITVHWNSQVERVLGENAVTGVSIRDTAIGASSTLACTGLFAYVGLQPAVDFLPATVVRDAVGFVVTDERFRTGLPGVYAAGAVRSGYGGLLKHAMAEGSAAAEAAVQSLKL